MMEREVTTQEITTGGVERGSTELEGSYDCSSSEISLGTEFVSEKWDAWITESQNHVVWE